ncbi:MAG: hypothetical protein JW829_16950, partial [Pirellulales bacterium]|nr:hypothetical protein [Pirellulales bacterium]
MRIPYRIAWLATAAIALTVNPTHAENLLLSGDFEPPGDEVAGWTLEQYASGSGTILNTAELVTWYDTVNSSPYALWLRAFEGGSAPGPDNLTNAILSQTVPGTPGETYTFSGYAKFEMNYSGTADALEIGLIGGPLVGNPSPTQTVLELAFLDAGGGVLGTPWMIDLGLIQNPDGSYEQHEVVGQAPAGTSSVRVTAAARDMVYNTDPKQSAFWDTFSLTGASNPGIELLTNPTLDDPPPTPLDAWTITIDDPANPGNDEVIRANSESFANHTPGGTTGIWLSSFLGEIGTEVDGIISQIVPGVEGGNYMLSGWSRWEPGYSGGLAFSTQTFMELAFLDGSEAVIGDPVTLDLRTEQMNDNMWRQHMLNGVAPTGTVHIRVSAGMMDGLHSGTDPQSAFFDDFVLELA